jgi:hypothetical protein
MMPFAAVPESVIGTFRTWCSRSVMSVRRGKADIPQDLRRGPKMTPADIHHTKKARVVPTMRATDQGEARSPVFAKQKCKTGLRAAAAGTGSKIGWQNSGVRK